MPVWSMAYAFVPVALTVTSFIFRGFFGPVGAVHDWETTNWGIARVIMINKMLTIIHFDELMPLCIAISPYNCLIIVTYWINCYIYSVGLPSPKVMKIPGRL
jgi:hypothetical protein